VTTMPAFSHAASSSSARHDLTSQKHEPARRKRFEEWDARMTLELVHGRNYDVGERKQVLEVSR
jgi:hypothetical protein